MQPTELLFQTIFDQMAEPRIVVLPDAPVFTVVTANKAYKIATGDTIELLNGQSLWHSFKADIASTNARVVFEQGLQDAIRHTADIKLPIFRFDIAAIATEKPKQRWWQVEINPVKNETGELVYLVCTTRNVTLHVEDQVTILEKQHDNAALLIRQQEQFDDAERSGQRNKELTDSEYRLNRIVESTPIGLSIIKGRDYVVETANGPMLRFWGRKKEAIVGQKLLDVLPDLNGQPFVTLLNEVFDSAKSRQLDLQPAMVILPNAVTQKLFIDINLHPLFNTENQVDAVLISVNDVTEAVKAKQVLQDREEELEVLNEELTASNEELRAINEELNKLKES